MVAEYKICREVAEQLVDQWPDNDRSWQAAIRAWESCGDLEQAIQRLKARVQKPSPSHALQVLLADMLERTHRIDEANDVISQGESTPATDDYATLITGKLRRRQGKLDDAIYFLTRIRPTSETERWIVYAAGYELARCYDQSERYQEAFHTIGVTKQRQLKEIRPWVPQALQYMQFHEQLASQLEEKHIHPSPADGEVPNSKSAFPLVMLGGFPRSGTTLVESSLARHSALRTLEETPAFSQSILNSLMESSSDNRGPLDVLSTVGEDHLAACRETYIRRGCEYFRESFGEHRWIDKNPTLTPAAPFFLRTFPQTKFVICVRDPRDVLLSNCFLPILQINSFNTFYFRLTDLAKWMSVHWECLKRFQEVAPNAVHLVSYESTIQNFEASLTKVLSFLDLPLEPAAISHAPSQEARIVRSPTYADVAKPLYSSAIGRWNNYAEQLAPAMEILEPMIADWETLHTNIAAKASGPS